MTPYKLFRLGLVITGLATMSAVTACQEYTLAPLPGYLGKEFFAVDLNNFDDTEGEQGADAAQFSVTNRLPPRGPL